MNSRTLRLVGRTDLKSVLLLPVLLAGLWTATLEVGAQNSRTHKKKLTKADIEAMMTSLSNWGRWGEADQLGALNLITPDKRRQAAGQVQEGVSISLARNAIKQPVDSSPAFIHRMVNLPKEGEEIASAADEYSVRYHGFTQTHMDGLCHLIYKGKMYNGFSQKEVTAVGARKLGVEQIKNGIFTRCVLMDIPRLMEVRYLEGTRAIFPEDLDAWEQKAHVKVESGDAVLIRTGRWMRRELEGPWDIMKNSAGLHASCLPWLKKRDVAVVGSDLALDVLPSGVDGFPLPVHWVCGVAMGTPILDNCDLEKLSELAFARKRWSFLLAVAPLAVEGGTGSPVNPQAIY
jgi:kynurenine formamidase